jgi:beta-glucosidase
VVQLYLSYPKEVCGDTSSALYEPPMQLRGFQKVKLAPGATQTVHLTLTKRDLSVWSLVENGWLEVNGVFEVAVGDSSADLHEHAELAN